MTTTELITRPEQVVELLKDLIEENASMMGLEFVGSYNEKLVPRYPAVVIQAGPLEKEVHATHTFNVTLRAMLWVYHGTVTLTYAQRSKEDLELATALVALLEDDKSWDDQMIFSYVEAEVPGAISPRSSRSEAIIGTRLDWTALTQQRWD